jgi:hypothetical protein
VAALASPAHTIVNKTTRRAWLGKPKGFIIDIDIDRLERRA